VVAFISYAIARCTPGCMLKVGSSCIVIFPTYQLAERAAGAGIALLVLITRGRTLPMPISLHFYFLAGQLAEQAVGTEPC